MIEKMILISHRGNLNGPDQSQENSPAYIEKTLAAGFNVEVDVWYTENGLFLGHDDPRYEISISFLKDERVWCHAKNVDSLKEMLLNNIHCFWHQEDDVALTSQGYIWTYPGKSLTDKSICVIPEKANYSSINCAGICSDYIGKYKEKRYDMRVNR